MPRTDVVVTNLPGPFASAGVTVTATAYDATNKNQFFATGRDLLVVHNTDATDPFTYTVNGVENLYNRTGNLTGSLVAGAMVAMFMKQIENFRQPDGMIYLEAEDVAVKFMVLRGGGLN